MNLSSYCLNLVGIHKERYLEKISVLGIDPYSIKLDECSTNLEEFPPTMYPDIVMYLVHTKSAYTMKELKAYKSLEAYNQAACGWVKKIAVKTFQSNTLVLGKVMHSQRLSEKLLSPWIITKNDGSILSAHCDCVAGLGEVCTHVSAVLFSLDKVMRRTEEKTPTGVKAYWMPPSNKPADPSKTANIDFSTAKKKFLESCEGPLYVRDEESRSKSVVIPPVSKTELHSLLTNLKGIGGCALQLVTEPFARQIHDEMKENQEENKLFCFRNFYSLENEQKSLADLRDIGQQIQFTITEDECKNIERQTKNQSKCKSWFSYRAGRITASRFKKCCRTKIEKPPVSLIKDICYPSSRLKTKALSYGCDHEKFALRDFSNFMRKHHRNLKIKKCGLFINPEYPYFGASPDGLVSCDCCGTCLIELKCPYCIQFKSILNLSENKYSFIKECNGDLQIKTNHDYYFQVQMQMAITKITFCYLVGWSKKDFAFAKIAFSESFWKENSQIAKRFFYEVILPECLGKYYTKEKGMSEEEIDNEENVDIGFYEELIYENPDDSRDQGGDIVESIISRHSSPQPGPSTAALYCLCRSEDDGKTPMIACESGICNIEWYHLNCVCLKDIPSNTWICNSCKEKLESTLNDTDSD